jgi:SAM-dependent methyltransferase
MDASTGRQRQENYAALQPLMLDERHRRLKARKIVAILEHFLGSVSGRRVLDIGCSGGVMADALTQRGARVLGVDIDREGLAYARSRFPEADFAFADGEGLPLRSQSIDVVVFNHIYEHVVRPDRVAAEIRRVLSPTGIAYLGLGNRLIVVEPHYRLPFLSWIPRRLADRYVRVAGKADDYHEQFLTLRGLKRLFGGFDLWDYTLTTMAEPQRFGADDAVGPRVAAIVRRFPRLVQKTVYPLLPTYFWIGTIGDRAPAGPPASVPPARIDP